MSLIRRRQRLRLQDGISKARLASDRAALPFDEAEIAAHLAKEGKLKLKVEIADRMLEQARKHLDGASVDLARARWQLNHDELKAVSESLTKTLRDDYPIAAAIIVQLFADLNTFNALYGGFCREAFRLGRSAEVSIISPLDAVGLRNLEKAFLPGLDGTQLWPAASRRSKAASDIIAALDEALG